MSGGRELTVKTFNWRRGGEEGEEGVRDWVFRFKSRGAR